MRLDARIFIYEVAHSDNDLQINCLSILFQFVSSTITTFDDSLFLFYLLTVQQLDFHYPHIKMFLTFLRSALLVVVAAAAGLKWQLKLANFRIIIVIIEQIFILRLFSSNFMVIILVRSRYFDGLIMLSTVELTQNEILQFYCTEGFT